MLHDVLVLGGSGFVGSRLCEMLLQPAGAPPGRVTVVTRRRDRARHLLPLPALSLEEGDVHDDATLARLVTGRSAVVNLIGVLHGDAAAFERAHAELPRRLAQACMRERVSQVVHISALGVSRDAPSMYLRSKAAGEDAWRDAGVSAVLLRPSVMFGARDRFLNLFARLSRFAPAIALAGADAQFQPVWVDDVVRAIVACLQRPRDAAQIYECAGPKVYTLAELVRLAGRFSGHERPVIALPRPAGEWLAWLMECLPGEPLLSRDNLASMRVPNVASGAWPGLTSLGIAPAALEAIAPTYLNRAP
jgi:NADH dehydrogenase